MSLTENPALEVLQDRLPIHGRSGLYELLGRELVRDRWHVVTHEAVDDFCSGTGEPRRTDHPMVPGFMTLGLLVWEFYETFEMHGFNGFINYGVNRMRLPHPLEVGVPIRARFKFVEVHDVSPFAVDATMEVTIERRGGGKPVCWAEWIGRGYEARTTPGPGCEPDKT